MSDALWFSLMAADQAGIKIEMIGGVGIWEAMTSPKHQRAIDLVRATIQRTEVKGGDCGCVHYFDIYIRLPDGSFKRPDIAIYCRELPDDESDNAATVLPEATIEIVSPGYEAKDLEIGPPFLLANGVKDVLPYDPRNRSIHHFRSDGTSILQAPQEIALLCGCSVKF